jgi:hypothetical protein
MWFNVQMWFPLLTIVLTAAICLGLVSFIASSRRYIGKPKDNGRCSSRFAVDDSPHNRDGLVLHGWSDAAKIVILVTAQGLPALSGARAQGIFRPSDEKGLAFLSVGCPPPIESPSDR